MMDARRIGLAAVLLALGTVAYLPSLGGGFLWDDFEYIVENPELRDAAGLVRLWAQPGATPQYYPLTFTTFWLEWQLWGERPLGYRLVNLALHLGCGLLLWKLLGTLGVPGAWLAAALWLVHPMHVESVAWISERKNVLATILYLAALAAWWRFEPPDGLPAGQRHSWRWFAGAEILFLLALLAKTAVLTLPAAIVLLAWYRSGRFRGYELLMLSSLAGWAMVLGIVTAHVERRYVGARGPEFDFTILERFLIAGRALWFYAGKLAWPWPVTFFYPRWLIDPADFFQVLLPVLVLGTFAVLWWRRRSWGRGPLAGVLFFAGTLAPALGFVSYYPMRFSFVANHVCYLASAGLLALAAAIGTHWTGRRGWNPRRRGLLAAAPLCILTAISWTVAAAYRDEERLWQHTLHHNPAAWAACNNLAILYLERADPPDGSPGERNEAQRQELRAKAADLFEQAVRLNPRAAEPRTSLGLLAERAGQDLEAIRHYNAALAIDPAYPDANLLLGRLLARQGHLEDSLGFFEQGLDRSPRHLQLRTALGESLAQLGRDAAARDQFEQVLAIDPRYAAAQVNLAALLTEQGEFAAAKQYLDAVLAGLPESARAQHVLARWHLGQQQVMEAVRAYDRVIPLTGYRGWNEAAIELAHLLATASEASLRNGGRALDLALRALATIKQSDPRYPRFLQVIAEAQAEQGLFEQAQASVAAALQGADHFRQPQLRAQLEVQQRLYQSGQPYRAAPPGAAADQGSRG